MKVHELVRELQTCDPDAIVVMSKDAEGNSYSPLAQVDDEVLYEPDSTWSGEVHYWDSGDIETQEVFCEALTRGAEHCVVLGPVN